MPAAVSPAFVITCAFVRIVPVGETTNPEPCAAVPSAKYEKTVTTPGERWAKIRAAEKPDAKAGAIERTAAGRLVTAGAAWTTTVSVVELPPTRPVTRPMPSPAAVPTRAAARATRATRTAPRVAVVFP